MNLVTLLMYAIFLVVVLLMAVPSVVACYRHWFGGGKLLSERLNAQFRSPPTTNTHSGRKTSKKKPGPSYIQPKSITDQSTHTIDTYDSIERR
ncbi:MAG: hypothetical protein GTO12_18040 [Proteobacteria bacterium]|nr:hypothetical protein [Pseudomonadota bacterium]